MIKLIYKNRQTEEYISQLHNQLNEIINIGYPKDLNGKLIAIGDAHGSLLQVIIPLLRTGLLKSFTITKDSYSFEVDNTNTSRVIFLGDVFGKSAGFDAYLLSSILIDIMKGTNGQFTWLLGNHDILQYWYDYTADLSISNGMTDFYDGISRLISKNGEAIGKIFGIDFIDKYEQAVFSGFLKIAEYVDDVVFSHTVLNKTSLKIYGDEIYLNYTNSTTESYENLEYVLQNFNYKPIFEKIESTKPADIVKFLNESFKNIVHKNPHFLITNIPYLWDRPNIKDSTEYDRIGIIGYMQFYDSMYNEGDIFECPHVIGHTNAIKRCKNSTDIEILRDCMNRIEVVNSMPGFDTSKVNEITKFEVDAVMNIVRSTNIEMNNLIFADSLALIEYNELYYLFDELEIENNFYCNTIIESPCCYIIKNKKAEYVKFASYDMTDYYN